MSKYKVGDKVVMEITDKVEVMEEPNYILSDATVVNQGYIDKAAEPLSTYIEQARAEGEQVAWELARKIVRQPINGGYKQSEFEEIFSCGYISDIFEKYTSHHELVRVKTTNMGTLYELTYTINLKTPEVSKQFIDDIRCRNGNLNIICGRESDKDAI